MTIRKHRGINQQTGRLKRGYKYSGKKLKSGLRQIVKVQQKKVQKGGVLVKEYKVLGVGSFGWIATPAVACKGTKNLYNKVSKFASKENSIDDIKMGKKLKKIDKTGKYFLYVQESCKIDTKKVEKVLDMDFTEMMEEEGKFEFYNLIMDKGDITIMEYFRKYKVGEKVGVKILIKLLKAIEKLIKNGFIHTDFHNENVILKKTSTNKYEFVIIDFGDMATSDKWQKYDNENVKSKKDFYKYGEKDMLSSVLSKVSRVRGKKFNTLLKNISKTNTIKGAFDIIKEAGYDLNMDLQVEKKDSIPKPPPKKSFFQKLFG